MKDLVCTVCKAVLVSKLSEQVITLMELGHCNRKRKLSDGLCMGKLEWRDSKIE